MKINFVDSNTGEIRQYIGFLIEDFGLLRERIGAEKVNNPLGISYELLDQKQFQRMALFQYMIGNYDWSFEQGRNVKVAKKNGKYIVIPYDFDFSGMVLAPYARINPDFNIKSLRQRVYLGYKEDLYEMKTTQKRFKRKRGKIRRTTKFLPLLDKKEKENVMGYIDTFYENLGFIHIPLKKLKGKT